MRVSETNGYLCRIVECFEHADTFTAQMQLNGTIDADGDSVVLERCRCRNDHRALDDILRKRYTSVSLVLKRSPYILVVGFGMPIKANVNRTGHGVAVAATVFPADE